MAEAQIPQNASLQDLECVVCNESLCDPKAFPCGHTYCGPPRTCLQSMEIGQGARSGMNCAVCRADHNLRVNQINPLYGISDLFPKVDTTDINHSEENVVHCATHGKLFTLWCKTCSVKICVECLDTDHDEHSMKKLKRHLVEQLELKFGGDLSQKLQMRKTFLLDLSDQMNKMQEKCEKQMRALNEKVTQAQVAKKEVMKEIQVIAKYLELERKDLELETKLLLCLNDANSLPRDLSNTYVDQTMSSSCQTECSSVTKSIEQVFQCLSEAKIFNSGEITLHVEQKNPFRVSRVKLNTRMWGFGFQISGQSHRHVSDEEMFRISIISSNPNGSFWDAIGIKYEVRLHNWVDPTNIIWKTGSTIGGGNISLKISDGLILHSQMMDPCRNWLNQEDNLKFSIDLSVYKIG